MAQIKAQQQHQGIQKGQLYKIYEQDDAYYYLLDHFNFGRVVQYPKKLQAPHNEKVTTQTPEAMP